MGGRGMLTRYILPRDARELFGLKPASIQFCPALRWSSGEQMNPAKLFEILRLFRFRRLFTKCPPPARSKNATPRIPFSGRHLVNCPDISAREILNCVP